MSAQADPADWWTAALAAPCASHTLDPGGRALHYLAWGDPADPPLVLVHGGLAHARWWSAIAPQLARDYYVIAPDLAGHGDSGWRTAGMPDYTLASWAADVLAVCDAACGGRTPFLAGHSLGGQITIVAAALYGARLAGAVVIDAPAETPDPESGALARALPALPVYPDLAMAMTRFRLLPSQPCGNPALLAYIARHSLRQVAGGWGWKFDPAVLARPRPVSLAPELARAACPLALVRGEHSAVVSRQAGHDMVALTGGRAPLVEIPCAWHHLQVDQPLALLSALRALLAAWRHPVRD